MNELTNFLQSSNISPIVQALFAGVFTWFATALGSAVIFVKKEINRKILDSSLGFLLVFGFVVMMLLDISFS